MFQAKANGKVRSFGGKLVDSKETILRANGDDQNLTENGKPTITQT